MHLYLKSDRTVEHGVGTQSLSSRAVPTLTAPFLPLLHDHYCHPPGAVTRNSGSMRWEWAQSDVTLCPSAGTWSPGGFEGQVCSQWHLWAGLGNGHPILDWQGRGALISHPFTIQVLRASGREVAMPWGQLSIMGWDSRLLVCGC